MSYFKRTLLILVIVAVIAVGIFLAGINFFTDWLWYKDLNADQVFLTTFTAKIWVRVGFGLLCALFIFVNLRFTRNKVIHFAQNFRFQSPIHVVDDQVENPLRWLTKGKLTWVYVIASILLGIMVSSISNGAWETVLKYLHRTPFGTADPIFSKDISFFVFQLPFFQLLYSLLTGLVILTGIVVGIIYLLINVRFNGGKYRLQMSEKLHLATLAVIFFGLKAFGYLLQMYQLVYSPRGVAFGASYTDIHVQLGVYKILMVIVGLLAIFTLINLFTKNMKLIYIGVIVWVVAAIVLGGIYPNIVQKYQVEPNEIKLESPYIQHNINYTLKAYGLDGIEERDFKVSSTLTAEDLQTATGIVENIRLWDWRPLQKTYSQLQELRLYYDIEEVDIDRYTIDGRYRQVMLAPRELNLQGLETRAQTWINQALKFTHGMGVVMSPVNAVTPEGMPELFIKNIPPVSTVDVKVTQPRIYFGEKTDNYVITNTKGGEFDYTDMTNNYDGSTGIVIKNIWRRLAFAIKYNSAKILLSSDIHAESKLLFDRNIKTRVQKITPFLRFDKDPYIVVNDDGRLYWIIDAYTTTNMYPYAEPVQGVGNYIRNSVKTVIDAYNGTVNYYISDANDPLVQTYAKIYPGLFKPFNEMPTGLQSHIRYPEDLFNIQTRMYASYHMKNPTTFFNKEDLWNIPSEKYAGETVAVQPYYMITQLPGEEDAEFILMMPFTPARKNNMVSWLVAKSDGDEYGKLVLYNFPKDRTIYGPMMVEARIDQDSVISQQLSLWDQKGSSVIRGNLLTIPIKDSILYIEPIYLQSQQTQLPELKRIVVAFGDQVVMEETLEEGLSRIFGIKQGTAVKAPALDQLTDVPQDLIPLIKRALETHQTSMNQLKQGDFAGFGDKYKELYDLLLQIQNASKAKP